MKIKALLLAGLLALCSPPSSLAEAAAKKLADAEVRKLLIQQSLQEYSGNCPCPYNTMRNGKSCGGRSAYLRKGGEAPLCFDSDISPEMIAQWRRSQENTGK